MKLPDEPRGFAVDGTGTVHKRYADHVPAQRTKTKQGVAALGGQRLCDECFPPAKPAARSRRK